METKCGACDALLGPFESIHVAGEGPRCHRCFNRETADRLAIDFDEPRVQPIVVADADGTEHTFTVRAMLVPTGHEMEAIEISASSPWVIGSPCSATSKRTPGSSFSGSTRRCVAKSASGMSTARNLAGSSPTISD